MHIPDALAEALGWLMYEFSLVQPLLPTYLHLIVSALFPIFAGAFASLSRPSSAARPKKRKTRDGRSIKPDAEQQREGLSASDAVLFPVMAGCVLTSLYFIIKWLDDPALLNKFLNYYFATFSVLSVAKLVSDGLDVLHSVLFPRQYIHRGSLFTVKPATRTAEANDSAGITPAITPLPGVFSRLPLPKWMSNFAWFLCVVPWQRVGLRLRIHRIVAADAKLGIHGFEGIIAGVATVAYYNLVDKPWWLTNLMGFGFAYGAVQLMSPTTFATGSLLLGALFFYDIYFVFYTPMMVTVAQSLDVPIKLLFPRPSEPEQVKPQLSMLGLGDVVLPGLMVGLALRFDLYLHYLRKQRHIAVPSSAEEPDGHSADQKQSEGLSDESKPPAESGTESKPSSETTQNIKAPYVSPAHSWGPWLWTSPLARLLDPTSLLVASQSQPASETSTATSALEASRFAKPYFIASLVGYVAGMLVTLVAMHLSQHPQPALLYLVPGVVGSLWLTALARGEVGVMWNFSDAIEDEEEEKEQKPDDLSSKATTKAKIDHGVDRGGDVTSDSSLPPKDRDDSYKEKSLAVDKKKKSDAGPRRRAGVKLFELLLLAPGLPVFDSDGQVVEDGLLEGGGHEDEHTGESDSHTSSDSVGISSSSSQTGGRPAEHVDKRQRVR